MFIKVKDLLSADDGETQAVTLEPTADWQLEDLELEAPPTGEVTLTKLDDGLLAKLVTHVEVRLECVRCLEAYAASMELKARAVFSLHPEPDQWPIEDDTIQLDPWLREEIIVALPLKSLCREDCLGLCLDCGQVQRESRHEHAVTEN